MSAVRDMESWQGPLRRKESEECKFIVHIGIRSRGGEGGGRPVNFWIN